MPLIKVPVVINTGSAQILVVTEIPLTPPAFEIKDIDKEVIVEQCKAITDKVIINGILRKNINFKTFESEDTFDNVSRVCGDVRHCTVEIPFSLYIDVPGAMEGDDCQIEDAFVEGEKDELLNPTEQGTFETLLEKAVVKIEVKVTRTDQIDVQLA